MENGVNLQHPGECPKGSYSQVLEGLGAYAQVCAVLNPGVGGQWGEKVDWALT